MKTKIDILKILQKELKPRYSKSTFDQAIRGLGVTKAPEKR